MINNDFHPDDRGLNASQEDHWGTQLADVTTLHPPGTFSRNTQGGDIINGMAKELNIPNPANVIKFPKK